MKRALTQKVNPIPACEVDNCSMVGQLKPIPPEVNRRARTSAAMIGLAISMGASSLLMPQQGDAVMAAEPNPSPLPTVPLAQAETTPAPGVQQVKSITTTAAAPTSSETAPIKPLVLEHKIQEWQPTGVVSGITKQSLALREISSNQSLKINQAEATTIATNEPQASRTVLKALNGIGHDLKANNSVATRAESNGVAQNLSGQSAATEASTAVSEGELTNNSSKVNDLLKAKQAVALNRLKESSNRLRSSLAEWKSEESLNVSAQGVEPAVPVVVSEQLKSASVSAPAGAGEVANWQPKVASVEPAITKATEATETTTVNQPTAVRLAAAVYQVKPGDTIDAIGRNYGVSTAALAIANNLDNPNHIQISQLINIPQADAVNSQISSLNPYASEPVSPNFAARNQSAASAQQKLPIVTALAPTAGSNSISLPTVPPANWNPTPATASAASVGTDAVPPGYKGVKYEIPTEIAKTKQNAGTSGKNNLPVSTPNGEPSLFTPDNSVNQGPQANSQQPSSPYVERLRAEIMQLREQYRQQQGNDTLQRLSSLRRPYSIQNGTAGVMSPNPVPDANSPSSAPVNSEYSPNRYNEALQAEMKRRSQGTANNQAPIEIPVPEPTRTATRSSQSVVATAPLGTDVYQPYNNQTTPQMVSPELPSLGNPDNYLPGGANQNFNGYIWPTRGVLTSGYGWRWGRMHKGIDIAAPIGTPVFAAAPGVVVYARWNNGGYGNLVDIRHADGSLTRYGHNSRILVQEGQVVEQGQQIAAMGSTGYSTGPHCHFEVHPSGQGAVNPMAFLPRR